MFRRRAVPALKEVDKRAYLEVHDGWMAKAGAAIDLVAVAAANLRPINVALGDEIGNDPLGSSLRDPDALGDVPCTAIRVAGDTQQHVAVVGEKNPARPSFPISFVGHGSSI